MLVLRRNNNEYLLMTFVLNDEQKRAINSIEDPAVLDAIRPMLDIIAKPIEIRMVDAAHNRVGITAPTSVLVGRSEVFESMLDKAKKGIK